MDPSAAPTAAVAPPAAPQSGGGAPPAAAVVAEAAAPATACPMPASVTPVANSQKRRLAVDAFDYSAVKTSVTYVFGNDINIGQGIRAMLTAKMGASKSVVLLEREKLQKLETEQDRGATNRFAQGTKAKIGKLVGADAMLFGDIVIFGRDDTAKKSAAGGVGRWIPKVGGIIGGAADSRKTDKAVVAINLRIVDSETGEVLETAEARGESKRTSTDWGAMAGTWRGAAAANSSMTSSNFAETIIGEATNDAVAKIVEFLETKVPGIAAKSRTIEGRVANISGCTLYLSIGANDGVKAGDQFEVHKIITDVVDPQTHETIDQQTVKVGDFVAGTVRDKVSIGQYGGEPLNPSYSKGYTARLVVK
jgi:curli biogenesis system outer membrane secretion channel CsgG